MTQTAVMSAVFFTLFEFWKAQLKGPGARESHDRCAVCWPPKAKRGLESGGGQTVVQSLRLPTVAVLLPGILLCSGPSCPC